MNNEKSKDTLDGFKSYVIENKIKCIIVCVFLVLALLGLILSRGVKINYNLSDYLGEDTETSIALKIMTDEFGMTGNVQVMLTGIDKDEAKAVKETLSDIEGVLTVSFDPDSPTAYKSDTGSALFSVLVNGEDHSDTAKYVISEIKTRLGEEHGAVELGGSTIEFNALRENTGKEMGLIIVLSISLAALLLLVTASSWIEPILLLLCSGIAIAINMGLNLFIGEISYITNSVSSILQLALSVDYSIVLIHAYRDEKKTAVNNTEAMRTAVKNVLNPVSASALTTIAGLVALLFMSFTIGFDIGIVLIKGIVISAITAMTLLPVVVLMLDPILEKTKKKPFIPEGSFFSALAIKWNKIIAPIVAFVIVLSSILQAFNSYGFTDSIGTNKKIVDTFGRNDSIVVVYKSGDRSEDDKKEAALLNRLSEYKNPHGKSPLASYTAYSTTVRDIYTVNKAAGMLGIPEKDIEMLFAMYNLYGENVSLTFTAREFTDYANKLISSDDPDVANIADEKTKNMVALLNKISILMPNEYTPADLQAMIADIYALLPAGSASATGGISEFAIRQIYGVRYYDTVTGDKKINAKEFVSYAVKKASESYTAGDLTEEQYNKAMALNKIIQYENSWFSRNDTAFKSFMQTSYTYSDFITALKSLSVASDIVVNKELTDSIQQFYIMYFYDSGKLTEKTMKGRDFVNFVYNQIPSENPNANQTLEANKNTVIGAQAKALRASLNALKATDGFLFERNSDNTTPMYNYTEISTRLNKLQSTAGISFSGTEISPDTISGVYIKYALEYKKDEFTAPMMAYELLDFVRENMETNSLLAGKMDEDKRKKVDEAAALIESADGLFIGEEYSRVLLSVVIPAEGPEMTSFIKELLVYVQDIFGEDAHITGKVVSTYDLQAAFDFDNMIITVFTIVSILLVILFVFKSLSLPVILVLIIQGAVWVSLSLCLIGGGLIFFMSYIVTTCILMGATVDYGILMSNNYIVYRRDMDKDRAIEKAVDSAMPTVFTSGIILIVCGIVISLISSQNSIASVGTLLAQGAFISIIMITVGLPSILYLLDNIILKFTMSEEQSNYYTQKVISFITEKIPIFAKKEENPTVEAALAAKVEELPIAEESTAVTTEILYEAPIKEEQLESNEETAETVEKAIDETQIIKNIAEVSEETAENTDKPIDEVPVIEEAEVKPKKKTSVRSSTARSATKKTSDGSTVKKKTDTSKSGTKSTAKKTTSSKSGTKSTAKKTKTDPEKSEE